eukprot:TRINITY_DN3672_c0_g1_i10.p1 TRINITY_DN3672_c0_g1~~TRINITY_DN3672_c0_g1_i10.p1  ORF type:complete len:115 (-),score=5.26 TRINITY_DN3672_c0_g1_i10:58-402(-)
MLLISGILAFAYHLMGFLVIKYTSAHYGSLIGNVKVIFLVVISILLFPSEEKFTPYNVTGMVVTLIGFTLYNVFKFQEQKANQIVDKMNKSLQFKEWDINNITQSDEEAYDHRN